MNHVEAYRLIVGLVVMNDWDVFDEIARKHPAEFPAAGGIYREIGDTVARILSEYDFTKSVAFSRQIEGRTESFARAKTRFESEPVKRREHRQRLIAALKKLPASDEVFDLASTDEHAALLRVRGLVDRGSTGG